MYSLVNGSKQHRTRAHRLWLSSTLVLAPFLRFPLVRRCSSSLAAAGSRIVRLCAFQPAAVAAAANVDDVRASASASERAVVSLAVRCVGAKLRSRMVVRCASRRLLGNAGLVSVLQTAELQTQTCTDRAPVAGIVRKIPLHKFVAQKQA